MFHILNIFIHGSSLITIDSCARTFIFAKIFFAALPSWCVCHTSHCHGLCTLIVGSLQMAIKKEAYLELPYVFRSHFPWYDKDIIDFLYPLIVTTSENVEQLQDAGLHPGSNLEYTGESTLNLSNSIYSDKKLLGSCVWRRDIGSR